MEQKEMSSKRSANILLWLLIVIILRLSIKIIIGCSIWLRVILILYFVLISGFLILLLLAKITS
jgi:hypothetical protein